MKKVFYRKDQYNYNDCYNNKGMDKITSQIDGDKANVIEILDVNFPLLHKYWFIYNNCGLTNKQMGESVLFAASIALIRYEELNPDDNYVADIVDILRASHLTSKRLNTLMISYKQGLQNIVTESIDDTKYITIGVIHLMDAIHSINEGNEDVIDHINSTMSYFIKGLVSRDDLKEELINYWKKVFK